MSYIIDLTDEAKLNIKQASDYYLEISTSLNDKFISDLIKTIDILGENPLHFQIRYRNIRIAITKTYPFGIHFIIEGNIIHVLKVLHSKRFYK